jgi:hypothetical protein
VRSYGGSAKLDRQLEAIGVRVVQLGFPGTLDEVRQDVLRVGGELGAGAQARERITGFEADLAAAKRQPARHGTALYVTLATSPPAPAASSPRSSAPRDIRPIAPSPVGERSRSNRWFAKAPTSFALSSTARAIGRITDLLAPSGRRTSLGQGDRR